ncbi:MAG: M67 family metallopeptidase [Deltaproteobacteria bacterium]
MKVPKSIIDEMLAHAKKGYPYEVCGLMAGKDGVVTRVFRMTNIDKSSISYMMDPTEQFSALKDMRVEGLELMAIYHSHPTSPAYPSQTDVQLAFYPEASYIIISLKKVSAPDIKGYRILDGRISEEVLEVTP